MNRLRSSRPIRHPSAVVAVLVTLLCPGAASADDIAGFLDCNGCVSAVQIGDGSITSREIRLNAVTGSKVQNGSLTGADIRNNSISGVDIRNGSIRGVDIRNNSISSVDIRDEPGIEFVQHSSFGSTMNLTTRWRDATTLAVSHPAKGFINCVATGVFEWRASTNAPELQIGWGFDAGDQQPEVLAFARPSPTMAENTSVPVSVMYTTRVTRRGTTEFRLKARRGSDGGVGFYQRQSAACMYFSSRV